MERESEHRCLDNPVTGPLGSGPFYFAESRKGDGDTPDLLIPPMA